MTFHIATRLDLRLHTGPGSHPALARHAPQPPVRVPHTAGSRAARCHAAAAGSSQPNDESSGTEAGDGAAILKPVGLLQRLKTFFLGSRGKLDKERLAALGTGAFLSYSVISNLNAGVLLTIAWLTVLKTKGATPLAPGLWSHFLAAYAALWVTSHFMRPIRLSLAIAAAPAFNNALEALQHRLGLSKPLAIGVMLLGVAASSACFLLTSLTVFGGFPDGLLGTLAEWKRQ